MLTGNVDKRGRTVNPNHPAPFRDPSNVLIREIPLQPADRLRIRVRGHDRVAALLQHVIDRPLRRVRNVNQDPQPVQLLNHLATKAGQAAWKALLAIAVNPPLRCRMHQPRHPQSNLVVCPQHRYVLAHQQILGMDQHRDLPRGRRRSNLRGRRHELQVIRRFAQTPHRVESAQHPLHTRRPLEERPPEQLRTRVFGGVARRRRIRRELPRRPLRKPDAIHPAPLQLRDIHLPTGHIHRRLPVLDPLRREVPLHVQVRQQRQAPACLPGTSYVCTRHGFDFPLETSARESALTRPVRSGLYDAWCGQLNLDEYPWYQREINSQAVAAAWGVVSCVKAYRR